MARLWLPRGQLGVDGFWLALLFGFPLFVGRCRLWRRRALALFECFSLSSSGLNIWFVCCLNLLDSGILFGLHLHSCYFAGMVAVGWDGCNGVVVGALVQALLDFGLFQG